MIVARIDGDDAPTDFQNHGGGFYSTNFKMDSISGTIQMFD